MLLLNGGEAKRIANNAILERLLIRNMNYDVVSQFHIRPSDDEKHMRSSDVIFTEGYFNIKHTPIRKDRIVFGIWSNERITSYICVIFANVADAEEFAKNVEPYIFSSIEIQFKPADILFSADLRAAVQIY